MLGQQEIVHPGYSIKELPVTLTGSRARLVTRTHQSPFFQSEERQPLFTSFLSKDSDHHYKAKKVVKDFPFNDFLGVKDGEELILTKNLSNTEKEPVYAYSSQDFLRTVELAYRSNGNHEVALTEADFLKNGDNSERITRIIFNKENKIVGITDSQRVVNKNLMSRWESHGIRYQYVRKGDSVEVRISDTIDVESEKGAEDRWNRSETNPTLQKPEHLKYPENYLSQNMKPDDSLSKLPIDLFVDKDLYAQDKAPSKNTLSELPPIFQQSWGPNLKVMNGVGKNLEDAMSLLPPPEAGRKTHTGIIKREQLGDAPWAAFLDARPDDEIELSSVEMDGGRKMLKATCRKNNGTVSISALDNSEEVYATAEEGQFARTVSFSNSPSGEITQLDDVRVKYDKPGGHLMEINYIHRYDASGNRTPINQLKSNSILPVDVVGIDPSIRATLFSQGVK